MKITYNKNPLFTTVELDEQEKKELWLKIKVNQLEEMILGAELYLNEDPQWFNLEKARKEIDSSYLDEIDGKSKLDNRCDQILSYYLEELQSSHIGDCICFPCSCGKCHAEATLGINTIPGLSKYVADKINNAFGNNNERTIEQAISFLANYNPIPIDSHDDTWKKIGGYEQHIPRWIQEAKLAHDWLVNYKITHLKD